MLWDNVLHCLIKTLSYKDKSTFLYFIPKVNNEQWNNIYMVYIKPSMESQKYPGK